MTYDDAPPLADLMPWSVAPLRPGRGWPMAPDAASLRARWDAFVRADAAGREALFGPTRARTLHTSVAQLPGCGGGTGRLARENGPCAEPVRVVHGPFDEQWLIPDHRLLDAARPELWRVAGAGQLFLTEQGYVPDAGAGPAVLASAVLPDGHSPAGRPGRVRPLYRRPGGAETNVLPGLLEHLSLRYGTDVAPEDFLAWVLVAARAAPAGPVVPLTSAADAWERGVELGRRALWLQLRGSSAERPKLPGGRRPYVRAPLPALPSGLGYDADEEALRIGGGGLISPVPAGAWDFRVSGVRVLELWFERRAAPAEPGTLEAVGPSVWPQAWTSQLLELITVLALLAELPALAEIPADAALTAADLHTAGVLPVPAAARRPASVLDHHEEGPEGQFALL
ncbi:hypothetical protein FHS40_005138 [Streptomyces spectabilis]|uniref:DNA methyltransferase n=1 Tax=Streptomyces spectabilis TaxID=68270 RepID=A0A5P2XLY8_STRST|nr:hypothetical protein [Streptomyces spectabilis]QEV64564.1 DNA methyltransferase [Streptomyces spectabilis]